MSHSRIAIISEGHWKQHFVAGRKKHGALCIGCLPRKWILHGKITREESTKNIFFRCFYWRKQTCLDQEF